MMLSANTAGTFLLPATGLIRRRVHFSVQPHQRARFCTVTSITAPARFAAKSSEQVLWTITTSQRSLRLLAAQCWHRGLITISTITCGFVLVTHRATLIPSAPYGRTTRADLLPIRH